MVKRPKSPEITEDIRLFVVWVPYPLNPNWVYDEDVQDCAKWVAEVIGNESYLYSIHRKTSSRGMILLEISKEFTDHGRLLGEHQWCDFLKDANREEEGHKTCVYYSIYSTCREANKDGWKPIAISARWFKDWEPGLGRFVSPYPEPRHCPPPPEDRTTKQICRHIPLVSKPPPTKSNDPPVVGSWAWIARQQEEVPDSEHSAEDWRTQDTMKSATTANNLTTTPNPIGQTSISLPQSPGKSMKLLSTSKPKAIPLQKFMSQPADPQKRVQAPAWVTRTQSSPPSSTGQMPPTMLQPSAKPQNAWAKPLKIVPPKPVKITNDPHPANSCQVSRESWFEMVEEDKTLEVFDNTPDGSIYLPRPLSSTRGNFNSNVMNEAESSFHTTFQHSDNECDLEDIVAPVTMACTEAGEAPNSGPSERAELSDTEEDFQKKKPDILCPTHGPACTKKICKDYKKLEWEQRKEEAKKSGQWRGRGRGRWAFKTRDAIEGF